LRSKVKVGKLNKVQLLLKTQTLIRWNPDKSKADLNPKDNFGGKTN